MNLLSRANTKLGLFESACLQLREPLLNYLKFHYFTIEKNARWNQDRKQNSNRVHERDEIGS